MCSRASRSVYDSFSFWETAWASWPLVSSRRSSSVRIRLGVSWGALADHDEFVVVIEGAGAVGSGGAVVDAVAAGFVAFR